VPKDLIAFCGWEHTIARKTRRASPCGQKSESLPAPLVRPNHGRYTRRTGACLCFREFPISARLSMSTPPADCNRRRHKSKKPGILGTMFISHHCACSQDCQIGIKLLSSCSRQQTLLKVFSSHRSRQLRSLQHPASRKELGLHRAQGSIT
jgi:hypothetical protein